MRDRRHQTPHLTRSSQSVARCGRDMHARVWRTGGENGKVGTPCTESHQPLKFSKKSIINHISEPVYEWGGALATAPDTPQSKCVHFPMRTWVAAALVGLVAAWCRQNQGRNCTDDELNHPYLRLPEGPIPFPTSCAQIKSYTQIKYLFLK